MLMSTEALPDYQLSSDDWLRVDQLRISQSMVLIKGISCHLATDTLSKHRLEILHVAAA